MTQRSTAVRLAAAASLGAGVIHAVVVPDHAAVWWVSGAFFALLAAFQLAWGAALLLGPGLVRRRGTGPALLGAGLLVNAATVLLWAMTRWVTGEPFGPNAGTVLPLGPAGIGSTVLQVALLVALLVSVRLPAAPARGLTVALVAGGALLLAPTAWGVSGALSHDHAAHADGDHHDDDAHDDGGDDDHHGKDDGHHDPVEPTPSSRPSPSAPSAPSATSETSGPDDRSTQERRRDHRVEKPRERDTSGHDDGHHDGHDNGHDH